jgi:hypothetical protein
LILERTSSAGRRDGLEVGNLQVRRRDVHLGDKQGGWWSPRKNDLPP